MNYKTLGLLKQCILSLKKTIRRTPYEIIVIDSESDGDAPRALGREFPGVRCFPYRENTGYGRGVNEGIRRASGDYFLILNPDIIVQEHAVDSAVSFMEGEGRRLGIGMLGPKLLNPDGTFQPSAFRFYTPLTILLRRTFLGRLPFFKRHIDRFLMKDKHLEASHQVQYADWVRGGALCASREAIEKVGLMDERFFMYFEDVDWARRFWENGYKVAYYPKSALYHQYLRTSHRFGVLDLFLNKMARFHIASALKYFWKYRFRTTHYV